MSTSPSVLLIAGSPSRQSRSAALLDSVAERLLLQKNLTVDRLNIRELSASALLLADWDHPSIVAAIAQVARPHAVVVATPVYKAAYSGVLKVFLDLLPQTALKDKTVLPLATAGSLHHMLALDYALRPVLQVLSAGIFSRGFMQPIARFQKPITKPKARPIAWGQNLQNGWTKRLPI